MNTPTGTVPPTAGEGMPELASCSTDELQAEVDRRHCARHPAHLLAHVACIDTETGEEFGYHFDGPSGWEWNGRHPERTGEPRSWSWQRDLLDWWLANPKTVVLKARQLGVTWLASGLALWQLLYRPGTRVLAVSITERDATKILQKTWTQLQSLPPQLRDVKVLKPARGAEPSDTIELRHPDGRLSTMISLTSTPRAGQGETASLVILDEFSRQEYAGEAWKAVLPTAAKGAGRIVVISTGNGISTGVGQGNFFHYVYKSAEQLGVQSRFLGWDLSPDRDEDWYQREATALPPADRGEQYPRDEDEAFILTGDPYFDREALQHYREHVLEPETRGTFVSRPDGRSATFDPRDKGLVRVYSKPEEDRKYAIGVDTATGRGQDNSSALVVDLGNLEIVAEIHGNIDPDIYSEQLHFLGKWFGRGSGCERDALIGVEDAGGFGTPIIIFLRDGKEGRPPYPNLYRHRQEARLDQLQHKAIGYPVNSKTRPLLVGYLSKLVRERAFTALPADLLSELGTFVHRPTNPSPRAQEGCHDDRVMSFALACELYRQRGEHPNDRRPRRRRTKYTPTYPWEAQP